MGAADDLGLTGAAEANQTPPPDYTWSDWARAVIDLSLTLTPAEATERLAQMRARPPAADNSAEAARREQEDLRNTAEHRVRLLNGSPEAWAKEKELNARAAADKIDRMYDETFVPPTLAVTDEAGMTPRDKNTEVRWMKEDEYSRHSVQQWDRDEPVPWPEYATAVEQKKLLLGDPEWVKRYQSGDRGARIQMDRLNRIIVLGPKRSTA